MNERLVGNWFSSAALIVLLSACGGNSNNKDTCKTGSEACVCYPNNTCDAALSCLSNVCVDLGSAASGGRAATGGASAEAGSGADGALAGNASGGAGAGTAGSSGSPSSGGGGAANAGGMSSAGASANSGGTPAGGASAGGSGLGGSLQTGSGGANTAGSSGAGGFATNAAGCALVTSTCTTCCDTTGVFALDAAALDVTNQEVLLFDVTSTAATAEFRFTTADEVGAIFFRFLSPQTIGSLGITVIGNGGSLEIALVRGGGSDGCIYPIVGSSLSSIPSSCWGLGAGPYAALPADQIEVRVRSLSSGAASLVVEGIEFAP